MKLLLFLTGIFFLYNWLTDIPYFLDFRRVNTNSEGNQPYFTYPRILGHELAAVIDSIGENSDSLKAGDPVAILPYMECGECIACRVGKTNCCTQLNVIGVHSDGGMQEWISVPADHLVKADGLDLDETALVECLAIGAHAVRRAGIQSNEFQELFDNL